MKNLLKTSSTKIYLASGLSMLMVLGSMWHFHYIQKNLDKISTIQQGVSTCFNRVSQTFTALMIKDVKSPYLNKNFMNLSEECLAETLRQFEPLKSEVLSGLNLLNQLVSEVSWFHQSVLKMHSPLMLNQKNGLKISSFTTYFGRLENLKMNLSDEITNSVNGYNNIKKNDIFILALSFIILIASIGLLSAQEVNHLKELAAIENRSLNLMQTGKEGLGSMIDDLVDSSLMMNNLPVTAQIFKDYHEDLLEKLSAKSYTLLSHKNNHELDRKEMLQNQHNEMHLLQDAVNDSYKTSLLKVVESIQKNNQQDLSFIDFQTLRDVDLNIPFELIEQILSSAIFHMKSKILSRDWNLHLTNQIHSDKSIINFQIPDFCFEEDEIRYFRNQTDLNLDRSTHDIDVHLVILKELIKEAQAQCFLENKIDRHSRKMSGHLRLIVERTPKSKNKLISLKKGKKKDLVRSLMN